MLLWRGGFDHLAPGSRRRQAAVAAAWIYFLGLVAAVASPTHWPLWLTITVDLIWFPAAGLAIGEFWRGRYLGWHQRRDRRPRQDANGELATSR